GDGEGGGGDPAVGAGGLVPGPHHREPSDLPPCDQTGDCHRAGQAGRPAQGGDVEQHPGAGGVAV
ncbi:MAG: hypothetical protein AVDCRST_MAG18-4011, partial [uncultured Thermomicrobiales bacterium]